MIKVAVVGAGHWGPNLIGNLHNHRRSEVSWVIDRDENRLEAVRQRFLAAGHRDAQYKWRAVEEGISDLDAHHIVYTITT